MRAGLEALSHSCEKDKGVEGPALSGSCGNDARVHLRTRRGPPKGVLKNAVAGSAFADGTVEPAS